MPELCAVEHYATVHHLVSTVVGELAPERGAVDLLRVAFPGGSITGAPKVRAMQIIAELEPTQRAAYCGSIGYLSLTGALDLLRAAFPGGSITGAPKLRAMEIIAELEPSARGVYCGAIGYSSLSGALDTSIPIRTAVMKGGRVYLSAGGGIVADSDAEQEYRETLDKARGMIDALIASA